MRPTLLLAVALALLIGLPPAHAQDAPADPSPPAAAASAPANADSSGLPDRPSLITIRNFTQVYAIIRKAYVKPVDNKTLMQAAIRGMLSELDPHSAYLDRDGMNELTQETTGKYAGLGVIVTTRDHKLTVIAPLDGSPAAKAGLESGDVILTVDGKPVDPNDVQASIDKLHGKAGSKITLTFVHLKGNMPITKTLTREYISMATVDMHSLTPDYRYAYIRISQFQDDTARDLTHDLTAWIAKHGQPAGVVLDLRDNPGGVVSGAVGVADAFLSHGRIVSTRGRIADSNSHYDAHPGDLLKGAPMVVLVNHGTASAAEIVSGALKDNHRALIMGRRTFGKGVVQTVIPIDVNHILKLTTARYYTPNGASIQAEGITPDIIIPAVVAHVADAPPTLIDSETDLPHHLDNANPGAAKASRAASKQILADNTALAEDDYALSQAFSVLQGMVLARQQHAQGARGG